MKDFIKDLVLAPENILYCSQKSWIRFEEKGNSGVRGYVI